MNDIVLPDTSLCAIVRDEVMNPAGGILRFLRSVVPHVEEAIIVDTGSEDGTLDLLEEAEAEFCSLKVSRELFKGYPHARNLSLVGATKKWVLVLDADELIEGKHYGALYDLLRTKQGRGDFEFRFIDVFPDSGEQKSTGHPVRLFERADASFYSTIGWTREYLTPNTLGSPTKTQIPIHHFRPSLKALTLKGKEWHHERVPAYGPCKAANFSQWKEFNPLRNKYKGSSRDVATKVDRVEVSPNSF